MASTVWRGLSELSGFWKTICARRRNEMSGAGGTSSPAKRSRPASAGSSRSSSRPSVDLPQPDSPTRPSTSLDRIPSETSSTACTEVPPRRCRARARAGIQSSNAPLRNARDMWSASSSGAPSRGMASGDPAALRTASRGMASGDAAARGVAPSGGPSGVASDGSLPGTGCRRTNSARWQRAIVSPEDCSVCGAVQASTAKPQRVRKLQPGSAAPPSGTTMSGSPPGIGSSRPRCARSGRGSAPSRPRVYGWPGAPSTAEVGPDSTVRPAYSTVTRSQMRSTMPRLWLTSSIDSARRRRSPSSRSRICASTVTSSAVVGSSSSSSSGSGASAIASVTRCFMPPESWCG